IQSSRLFFHTFLLSLCPGLSLRISPFHPSLSLSLPCFLLLSISLYLSLSNYSLTLPSSLPPPSLFFPLPLSLPPPISLFPSLYLPLSFSPIALYLSPSLLILLSPSLSISL